MAYTTAPDTVNARVDFAYDAYGRRVLETVTGGDGSTWWKRQYIWDGWRLLQERNALTGAVLADYYYGPNYVDELLLCRRDLDGNGSYAADGSEDFYYLTDHQYSTLAVVDGTGTIVERYSYTPFGEASYYDGAGAPIGGSAIGNRFLFTGRERHEILPLYDYRNRMYDPGSGRFLSPDPVYDPANLGNVYTYLNNNPLSTLDPYGEGPIDFLLTGYWNPSPGVRSAANGGFFLGANEGAIVVADAATFGFNSELNSAARTIKADARARGDVLSQAGFGLGAVGVEAAYAAVGGTVIKGVLTSGRGTAFVIKHTVAVRRVTQAASGVGAAAGGVSIGQGAMAVAEGDYAAGVHRLGSGLLVFAGTK